MRTLTLCLCLALLVLAGCAPLVTVVVVTPTATPAPTATATPVPLATYTPAAHTAFALPGALARPTPGDAPVWTCALSGGRVNIIDRALNAAHVAEAGCEGWVNELMLAPEPWPTPKP